MIALTTIKNKTNSKTWETFWNINITEFPYSLVLSKKGWYPSHFRIMPVKLVFSRKKVQYLSKRSLWPNPSEFQQKNDVSPSDFQPDLGSNSRGILLIFFTNLKFPYWIRPDFKTYPSTQKRKGKQTSSTRSVRFFLEVCEFSLQLDCYRTW